MINNCGIIKRPDAPLIQKAFNHYKRSGDGHKPSGNKSIEFRKQHSHASRKIEFVGVWDTVGAMGIPISFLGLFDDKDEFYDAKMGKNIRVARHALAIDEHRSDFVPTVWLPRNNMDIKQVWFAGAHCDIGGSYEPDKNGSFSSDIPLSWMIQEAGKIGLTIESHLKQSIDINPLATIHESRRSFYRIKKKFDRSIDHGKGPILIHKSVKLRWDQDPNYRSQNLQNYVNKKGWGNVLVQ